MARKSRKSIHNKWNISQEHSDARNLTGIYIRLSIEDNGYKTKDSIENQAAFLKEYVEKNTDEFYLVHMYIDNGTTGTNFHREEWNRMLDDIKSGKIDCIVVKDFSRIGRNYIEVGTYLEKIFPFLNVRVVAVNENFDSKKHSFQNSMLMNSLINIVNEYYARDISKKVKQSIRTMQKKGEFVSGVPPYGYMRLETDRKKLTSDPECAVIVKKIFEWRSMGKGCGQIALILNELALPSPGRYRYMNDCSTFKRCKNALWKSKHVAGILTNPVYLGHMVQGKTQRSYFEQGGKACLLPKEEWIVVRDTHEPLVTQEQFDIAARMAENSQKRHTEQMNSHSEVPRMKNPLSKKIYCAQCGGRMTRRSKIFKNVRDYFYFCDTPKMRTGYGCTNTHVHEVPLMEAVLKASDSQLKLLGELQNQWNIRTKEKTFKNTGIINNLNILSQKRELEEKTACIKRRKQELYENMKAGLLTLNDFSMELEHLTIQQRQYEEQIRQILNDSKEEKEIVQELGRYRENVVKIADHEIPLELLDSLIEKIVVYSPKQIEITYTYTDVIKSENAGFM